MTQTPYQVESFDIVTGKTVTLLHDIEDLRTSMAEAQSDFDRKDELDAAAAQKRQELSARVAELTQLLRSTQSELDQLNAQGSTRDQFIAFASSFEQRISALASGVFNYVLDRLSQERFDSDCRSLTPNLQEEILFRNGKLNIKRLTQGSFARLHKHKKEQITNELVDSVMERVYSASEALEAVLNSK